MNVLVNLGCAYSRFPEDGITEPTEGVFCDTVESCVQAFKNLKSVMNPRKYLTLLEDKVKLF
jgi:hypothetical protein